MKASSVQPKSILKKKTTLGDKKMKKVTIKTKFNTYKDIRTRIEERKEDLRAEKILYAAENAYDP